MIKKYSLLTILTVIILVGSSAEHLLGQLPPIKSLKGQKAGKRGIITNVKKNQKQQKKKPRTLEALELSRSRSNLRDGN